MKIYIWSKKNVLQFNNHYGESLVVVLAEDSQQAIQLVREKYPMEWEEIQGLEKYFDLMGPLSHPTHIFHSFYQESKKIRIGGSFDNDILPGFTDVWVMLMADYDRAKNQHIEEVYLKGGYGEHSVQPEEFELTNNLIFVSRAAD